MSGRVRSEEGVPGMSWRNGYCPGSTAGAAWAGGRAVGEDAGEENLLVGQVAGAARVLCASSSYSEGDGKPPEVMEKWCDRTVEGALWLLGLD